MISVAVMAHRSRERLVVDLVQSIDADVFVAWDQRNNEWDTARRALLGYGAARWHVVLQDDAVVCRDLVAGLTEALTRLDIARNEYRPPPNAMVSLYFGQAKPYGGRHARTARRADDEGCGWVRLPQLHWGVGLALPVPLIDEVVRVGDRTHVLEYDRRLSTVARKMSMPVWYTWPSLVEHGDVPSLLRHDGGEHRRAHRFEGVDWSALTGWWNGPVLTMPKAGIAQTPRRVSRPRPAAAEGAP